MKRQDFIGRISVHAALPEHRRPMHFARNVGSPTKLDGRHISRTSHNHSDNCPNPPNYGILSKGETPGDELEARQDKKTASSPRQQLAICKLSIEGWPSHHLHLLRLKTSNLPGNGNCYYAG
ncbi:hypothetical protein GJ744_008711 [Endocarpon pusillum]|uniref:Uncharacterized protein n=1 Tax=Endocarpon pusillum TaxID=364733 RepID=A0A8H7AK16_9EURO|nr:hypothetical protein GJ744_008711 [Endocarpon pusillum]